MRIAFDLDGTLLPTYEGEFATDPLPWPWRLFLRERLRCGAISLMRLLQRRHHELWIYTSSLRPGWYIRLLFLVSGVRLRGVVNGETLARSGRGGAAASSKYPPAFGIDLLIDDAPGVELEGARFGFRVVWVEPADAHWAEKVLAGTEA